MLFLARKEYIIHTMPQTDQPSGMNLLLRTISEYLKLLVEDARLNAAEKLTKLLSVCVLFVLLTMLITVAMLFLTIAVSLALSAAISPLWAFIIVTAFYALLIVLVVTCRRSLIENPIARFITALIVKEPCEQKPMPENND